MAKTDRFLIAPMETGLQSDLKPWIIPDDAFQSLTNAYVFRGRVRKRFGSYLMNQSVSSDVAQLYSRVRVLLGQTDGSGAFIGVAPGSQWRIGQMFSVGSEIYTVYISGAALMLNTGPGTGVFDTANGDVQIANAAALTDVYYYPATPIIGILNYEDDQLIDQPPIAFDTQFSYKFINGAWEVIDDVLTPNPAAVWTGSDSQLMWGATWRGALSSEYFLFVTNFNAPDKLRYYNGTNWFSYSPVLNGSSTLITARLVIPFQSRLIYLNTVELNQNNGVSIGTTDGSGNFSIGSVGGGVYAAGQYFVVGSTLFTTVGGVGPTVMTVSAIATGNASAPTATGTFDTATGALVITGNNTNINQPVYYLSNVGGTQESFVNRCRYSQNGSPVQDNAFLDVASAGKGGYIDAPTKEQIVTCQLLKNRLIVYFESSTWELVWTGNYNDPFRWQLFNSELGCESTFSVVPFDKVAIAVGNVGIHACNGSNVERIDNKIPNDVFEISNDNDGPLRVAGIRDYYTEMVYWTFPSIQIDTTYPNRILVYNYKTGSWAYNNDTITAFGYWNNTVSGTWASTGQTWQQDISSWNSAVPSKLFRQIIAGNQEGFIFVVDTETTRNAPAVQITNMTFTPNLVTITAINHNLKAVVSANDPTGGDYIVIESAQGVSGVNGNIYPVYRVLDANTFIIAEPGFSGTYLGGGTIARVSNINIVTKQYNFYVDQGRDAAINKVDFLVDKTTNGQITVDYAISSSSEGIVEGGLNTGSIIGEGVLETSPYPLIPLENSQSRLWHPIYPMANGECIQLELYLNDNFDIEKSQIRNPDIAWSDFTLHAICFSATVTSSRLQ